MPQAGPWERYAAQPAPAPAVRQPAQARRQASQRYNGPLPSSADELFPALVQQESGGRAGAIGPNTRWGNALGRTQMLPATAREVSQRLGLPYSEDLLRGTTPEAAAYQDRLGRAYLQEGFVRTGNARDALHYYHGGPDRNQWGPKTRAYADSILAMTARGQGAGLAAQPEPTSGPWSRYSPVTQEQAGYTDADMQAMAAPYGGDASGQPIEVTIDQGVVIQNGRVYGPNGEDLGPEDQYQAGLRKSREERLKLAARQDDPEYQAEYEHALARSEGVPAWLENLTQGATLGAVPLIEGAAAWLDPNLEGIDRGKASQAARDASRDRQAALLADDPAGTVGMQLAGGLLTPGLKGTGNWIAGARGAERIGRAAAVGAAYGGASGIIGGEGDLAERAPQGLLGAGVGSATAGLLDFGMTRASAGAAKALNNPSAARRLSRRGVDLLPGQMMADFPVVGPTARFLEDHLGGFNPLMNGVRRSQNEQVIRAAGDEALSSLANSGPAVTVPKSARTGYEVSQAVRSALGEAYDAVTDRVSAVGDETLTNEMADIVVRAGNTLDDSSLARLSRILDSGITNRIGENGEISGRTFKDIEQSLRVARDKLDRPGATLEATETAEFVDEALEAVRNLIGRQFPEEAGRIRDINRGWAHFKRIERAVSGSAGMARQGTPTPGELTQAVDQMSSTSQIANQTGILQGLATEARSVLPSTVGDTGSGQKALLGSLGVLGTTGATVINPTLAAGIAAGAIAYSKPAISALNAVYRATDRRTADSAVAEIARLAGRNPALQPYYQAAFEAAQSLFGSQSPATEPARAGLLSPTAP